MSLDMQTQSIISTFKEHLQRTNSYGSQIESFLTRLLLLEIVALYESEIRTILMQRAGKTADRYLLSFVKNSFKSYRNLKTSDIRGKILAKFDKQFVDIFNRGITDQEETAYNNLIINRNLAAHGYAINMTFLEVESSQTMALNIISALERTLNSL